MIRNLDQASSSPFEGQDYDICICGSGFAGLSLALRLPSNLRILILEGGNDQFDPRSQAIYEGQNIGQDYFPLTATRLRQFGGTSGWWNGWSRPLDPEDFDKHAYLPLSGWPITHSDLSPYLNQTRDILDVGHTEPGWHDLLPDLPDFDNIDFEWSDPTTRLAEKYRDWLENSPNIECFLNANLTGLTLDSLKQRVESIQIQDYQNRRFTARARQTVLATGGIENPRLLLNFNQQIPEGLGNQHGWVGRCFTEHPHLVTGDFILEDSLTYELARLRKPGPLIEATEFLTPTRQFSERTKTTGFALRLVHTNTNQGLTFQEKIRRLTCRSNTVRDGILAMNDKRLNCVRDRFYNETGALRDGYIKMVLESPQNPDSRITLSEDQDQFGLRRLVLDWKTGSIEKHTIRTAMVTIAERFIEQGLGRVRLYDWVLNENAALPGFPQEVGGNHHMGTTRMSDRPETGVVDKNLKVFGIDNLYLAGSSVFPTVGHANPTMTIVQLSLRLADHLAQLARNDS